MKPQDVRRRWAERTGEFSPGYYAYYGPDEASAAVAALVERVVDRDGRILEIGCSSGRHLAHLHDEGFERLHGIDINESAIEVMRETFPDLAAAGTLHVGDAGDVLRDVDEGAFDAVFSVQTLQHIHPDDIGLYDEIARVTDDLLVTVELEGEPDQRGGDEATFVDDGVPLYHRDWQQVFADRGFVEVEARSVGGNTLRAFRPPGE